MSKAAPNVDLDYRLHFRKNPTAAPSMINFKGDNQYIWVYSRNAFFTGIQYGAIVGTASSIYARKLSHIPIYALAFGVSYSAFHAASAYFRNEI
jgi:hypothetical protein